MTSDDERWERDLRTGLGTLLDDVRPGQPPVAAVLRKGRVMRLSRRLAVVAGVAAVVAAALVIPAALRGGRVQPQAPHVGKAGLIAQGRYEGYLWRIVVNRARNRLCAGEADLRQSCVELRHLEHLSGPASLSGAVVDVKLRQPVGGSNGPPVWNGLFGIVRPDVTKIELLLADESVVTVRPVTAAGYRWVGVVLPPYVTSVVEATVYSGDTKIAYSVPYYGGELRPGTYFVSWLHPGQPGPSERARYIATGGSGGNGWDAFVDAGPWGYCVSLDAPVPDGAQQNCWSPASLRARARVIMRGGSPPAEPRWMVGTAGPSVAYLRMTLANGRLVKVRVAVFSGQGFYATQIGPGPAIVRWSAYDAAGRRLYGGLGPPDSGS